MTGQDIVNIIKRNGFLDCEAHIGKQTCPVDLSHTAIYFTGKHGTLKGAIFIKRLKNETDEEKGEE